MVTARAARGGWLACMAILFPAAVVGLSVILREPELVSSADFVEVMEGLGISAVLGTWVGFVLPTLGAFLVACAIRRGRPGDPAALLFGLSVLSLFLIVAGVGTALATVIPRPAALAVDMTASILLVLGLYLFPNGRFTPAWTRWVALVLIFTGLARPDLLAAGRAMGTANAETLTENMRWIVNAAALLLLGTWLPTQIYRYRRRSTQLERLQTRWVIFGFALILTGSVGAILLRAMGIPAEWVVWALVTGAVGSLILPVAAGFAILRHRLYEIDRIISRAISYTLLVGLLAGVYAGAVFAMTRLVPATGDLAVAGSTLAVAALFNPLRRGIQNGVDRRFNRSRYDASLLIDSFAARLRTREELGEVLSDLEGVLARAVEPSSARIWLRGTGAFRKEMEP